MRTLTVCPSRSRPRQCLQMVESFMDTAQDSYLLLCVDIDDPSISNYHHLLSSALLHTNRVGMIIANRMPITLIFNKALSLFPDWGFYHLSNDDFIYRTKGWDLILEEKLDKKPGIAYGDDLFQHEKLPTAPFITGKLIRSLGWLQMPRLNHLGGDRVWLEIGTSLQCLTYVPEVIIEHASPHTEKHLPDLLFSETNSLEEYEKSNQAFQDWYDKDRLEDIKKVAQCLDSLKPTGGK